MVFVSVTRRTPTVPVEGVRRMEEAHRAEKAGLRGQLAEAHAELVRLNAALVGMEQARTLSVVSGDTVPRAEHERVVAELATLRRAWEHGISFVADGDRPVVEHRHEEVA